MSRPPIHGRNRTISASMILDALGEALAKIKDEDDLTDADLGAVLGKSDDQAAKYRTGLAEMGAVALIRGFERWKGRLAGPVLELIHVKILELDPVASKDRQKLSAISRLATKLSEALENDEEVDDDELDGAERALEEASQAVDHYKHRLAHRRANVASITGGR